MNIQLRLRPVHQLTFRLRILDDGNGDPSNKRASIPFASGLNRDFYLRLLCHSLLSDQVILDAPLSVPSGRPLPRTDFKRISTTAGKLPSIDPEIQLKTGTGSI